MTRSEFSALCARVGLSEGQLRYARTLFEAYDEKIRDTEERILEKIVPVATEFFQSRQQGAEPSPAGNIRFAKYCQKHRRISRGDVISSLEALLLNLRVSMGETQLEAFDAAVRSWRRSAMLNSPRRSSFGRDLACHIDLILMVDEACSRHGEFGALFNRPGDDPILVKARLRCQAVLQEFEMRLDSMLPSLFWEQHDIYQRARQASMAGNKEAKSRLDGQYIRNWMRIYDLNTTTAETLAAILTDSGLPGLADLWLEEYYQAYYPRLYRDDEADLTFAWLDNNTSLAPSQFQQIEITYDLHVQRRKTIRRDVRAALLDLMQSTRMHGGLVALYGMAGQLPENWYELQDQLRSLSTETCARFRGILTEDQQTAFDVVAAGIRSRLANLE